MFDVNVSMLHSYYVAAPLALSLFVDFSILNIHYRTFLILSYLISINLMQLATNSYTVAARIYNHWPVTFENL